MKCNYCGHKLPDDAIYCDRCGEAFPYEKPQTVSREDIPTHIAEAFIITILCCFPFCIPAIINAARAKQRLQYGDYNVAIEASKNAEFWINFSLIMGGIVYFIYIFSEIF